VARLDEYKRKRDAKRTPEPFGRGGKRGKEPIFVVQRHDARRLHYDLRLERGGALASWAVPKGIPLEPGAQRLAVHVEDHPLEYATFEGEIPAGEYGAGTVEIWDRGTYELVEEKRNGGLTFRLAGDRLRGTWALVPAKLSGDEKNWLLIRKRDDRVAAPREERRYLPMLATASKLLPAGGDWLFEVKFDGYRTIASVREGEATLLSRRGNDLNERFPTVVRAVEKALKTPDCVVDGEVCALDGAGVPRFSLMQQGSPDTPLVYYVFDLLEVEGESLLDRPLLERRERLSKLLDRRNATVKLSEGFEDGEALADHVKTVGLEGVMAKRASSRYRPGERTREWLKVKPGRERQEFVIAGYTKGKGRRERSFGSLVLGTWRGRELVYVGNCGTGFTEDEIERLLRNLRPLERSTPPFSVLPPMPRVRKGDVVWVTPRLVCEVEFTEWTHDGHLRAPAYVGLREDKPAHEVRKEQPLQEEVRSGSRVLKLSNLDKVFWPGEGITKGDLLDYYRGVAPALVPHLRDRPFTMKRYPEGIEGGHFFQKDAPVHIPDWIPTFPYMADTRERPRRKKLVRAPLVNDDLALLWMVNMGCIDMNAWYSRVDRPDRPDFVLFDLDPTPEVGFRETVRVALLVKEALDALGLEGFPKTSGADGMHVLVPVERRYTYDDTRRFAEIVAAALARAHRGLVTTEWTKAKRRGVFIDAKQNGEGATIAYVYSVRPHPGAPVSAPLRWDEVTEDLDPSDFTMEVVLDRLGRDGDLYEPVLKKRQSLRAALNAVTREAR
jgi:bifunctional non-homologous end joining protein LigD